MQNLSGFEAEAPKESTGNKPIAYKGVMGICRTAKCKGIEIKVATEAHSSNFSETKVGDKILSIAVQIPEGAKENAKAVRFLQWNVDSEFGKEKILKDGTVIKNTPQYKLMGWLKEAGLKAATEEDLEETIKRLNSEPFDIHMWVGKFKNDKKEDVEYQGSKLCKVGTFAGQQGVATIGSTGATAKPAYL